MASTEMRMESTMCTVFGSPRERPAP